MCIGLKTDIYLFIISATNFKLYCIQWPVEVKVIVSSKAVSAISRLFNVIFWAGNEHKKYHLNNANMNALCSALYYQSCSGGSIIFDLSDFTPEIDMSWHNYFKSIAMSYGHVYLFFFYEQASELNIFPLSNIFSRPLCVHFTIVLCLWFLFCKLWLIGSLYVAIRKI